ncbi:MAG TPA: hypothetical protein VKE98_18815, partial [Gemmataceae bacterium]|nr:hypothetical protein [Gemmataceae bacterium]
MLALAAGGGPSPGELRLWDVDKGAMIATIKEDRGIRSVAFSPDGKHLATAQLEGSVKLRDPGSGKLVRTVTKVAGGANSVAFSADSNLLA